MIPFFEKYNYQIQFHLLCITHNRQKSRANLALEKPKHSGANSVDAKLQF